jgi:hypothetical protein
MKNKLTKIALMAALALAFAFTFSCSPDSNGGGGGGGGGLAGTVWEGQNSYTISFTAPNKYSVNVSNIPFISGTYEFDAKSGIGTLFPEYGNPEPFTVDGNKLTYSFGEFTKKGSSSPDNNGGGGGGGLAGTTWECTESYAGISVTYTLTFTASRVTLDSKMMGIPTSTYEGTYTLNGSSVTIEWDDGYDGSGSYSAKGNKLTSNDKEKHTFTKK